MHKAFNTESIEQLSVSLQASDEKRNVIEQQQLIEKDVNELLEVSAFEVAEAKIEELLQLFNLCDTEEVKNASAEKTAINLVNRSKLDEKLAEFDIEESEHEQSLASEQAELRSLKKQIDAMQLDEKISTLRQQEADIINEMEAGIVDTLKLRLGLHAITRGLQHFREKNQSSMLEAAKESFTRLTCGNYINLVTRPNDKGIEQLIATEQSGQSKSADGLSQGTRGQLYLALRIAAYHEYKQHRTPLPFIADDIFETFDEHRTSAALAEFSAMAEHGQVIYFTHHQHVVSLAKEMLPSINTISLN